MFTLKKLFLIEQNGSYRTLRLSKLKNQKSKVLVSACQSESKVKKYKFHAMLLFLQYSNRQVYYLWLNFKFQVLKTFIKSGGDVCKLSQGTDVQDKHWMKSNIRSWNNSKNIITLFTCLTVKSNLWSFMIFTKFNNLHKIHHWNI